MVLDLSNVKGLKSTEESMTEEEKIRFNKLKEALLSKNNLTRHAELVNSYNFQYADAEVLLGHVRHSCLGCYSGDVGYIKNCHHSPYSNMPCSLWLYRGGKVHKGDIPLFIDAWDRGYSVGAPDENLRITEIFVYISDSDNGQVKMLRWVPQNKSAVSQSAAWHLSKKALYSFFEGKLLKHWELVPPNEG
jgi:hypothetical protein